MSLGVLEEVRIGENVDLLKGFVNLGKNVDWRVEFEFRVLGRQGFWVSIFVG